MSIGKKYIQLPKFQTHQGKKETISLVEKHINENLSNFKDGEEISIEYKGQDGGQMYSTAVIKITDGIAKLFVSIEDSETLKIVDTVGEPKDKNALWVTDFSVDDQPSNIYEAFMSLSSEYKKLKEIVERHDYALANTLAGGDILLNAQKYDIENEHEQEKPEDAEYDDDYATGDTTIVSYDFYVGGTSLRKFSNDTTMLYVEQKYYLDLRLYNRAGERVRETDEVTVKFKHSENVEINERRFLLSHITGYTSIDTEVRVNGELIDAEPYYVNFSGEQEPDYKPYSEPNVHHMLIKQADTYEILMDNLNYLLVNELCWCSGDNQLYMKAKAKDGTIQLFVIGSGEGKDFPDDSGSTSGDTTAVTYDTNFIVSGNTLFVESTNPDSSKAVFVDENGILNINVGGRVNADNILLLNTTSTTGSTPDTPTGSTDGSTIEVGADGTADFGGTTEVNNGILSLSGNNGYGATVTPNGILEITLSS